MGCSTVTAVFLTLGMYMMFEHQFISFVLGNSPSSDIMNANDGQGIAHTVGGRHRLPMLISPRNAGASQVIRARLTPIDPVISDVLIDEAEDGIDLSKRQFDDYGHMRFGKRGEIEDKFDDYGHMRFGRGHV